MRAGHQPMFRAPETRLVVIFCYDQGGHLFFIYCCQGIFQSQDGMVHFFGIGNQIINQVDFPFNSLRRPISNALPNTSLWFAFMLMGKVPATRLCHAFGR